jgi:hypothetical protein
MSTIAQAQFSPASGWKVGLIALPVSAGGGAGAVGGTAAVNSAGLSSYRDRSCPARQESRGLMRNRAVGRPPARVPTVSGSPHWTISATGSSMRRDAEPRRRPLRALDVAPGVNRPTGVLSVLSVTRWPHDWTRSRGLVFNAARKT